MDEPINTDALFMGPKSENYDFFRRMLLYLMDDHADWRKFFHPDDAPVVTEAEKRHGDFQDTLQKTREALVDLAGQLQDSSTPWFSPRYLGHMNTDTLMAANLGYMLTILYNPNNCAYEGSPATTSLEIEVGRQLAALMGYDPKKAWGHITSGGTVANYEAIWLARNLASVPFAVRECSPDLVTGLDDWQLSNLSTSQILELLDQTKAKGCFEQVKSKTVRGTGMSGMPNGAIIVPQSKHYSCTKAVDIFGIGQDNLYAVPVREDYRMDIDALKELIDRLIAEKKPILAVVAVVGSTEEGAVDEVHKVVQLRDQYQEHGISFYLHIDAAYGGYARSLFIDEQNQSIPFEELEKQAHQPGKTNSDWLSLDVYDAFIAMPKADSITVDPHKLGYIPYAAGAIVTSDRRMIDVISYFAAYVFDKNDDNPMLLGSYIMEGSKAGAAVSAVWMAHRVVPLNRSGYGRIISASIEGAYRFYHALLNHKPIEIISDSKKGEGRKFHVIPLTRPDINIIDYAFHEVGNNSLKEMNELNHFIYEKCSYKSGPLYGNDFITSKTALTRDEYGDNPRNYVQRFGIDPAQWDEIGSVTVLRSCVLTPYLKNNTNFETYWETFINAMEKAIAAYY